MRATSQHRIPFRDAARMVGLTDSRLRQMARAGELRTARKESTPIGEYWTIDRAEATKIAESRRQ